MKYRISIYIIVCAHIFLGCSNKSGYGLISSEGHYLYSYYVTNGELKIKSSKDFDAQFETEEFKHFSKIVQNSDSYVQPEVIYMPIIQQIIPGDKDILIFERAENRYDGKIVVRLALECDKLKGTLNFPDGIKGYYMIDDWEWPPKIFNITEGKIVINFISDITGQISGEIDVTVYDDVFTKANKKITGRFIVVDKNKSLFLSKPARID